MLRSVVVGAFFKDLVNTDYETAFAIYHRRFSTNTTPKWPLAQPMRILGHNGAACSSSSSGSSSSLRHPCSSCTLAPWHRRQLVEVCFMLQKYM
jgi:hypothetical protein